MTATIADLMPERALQQAVEGIARTYGWLCYHTHDSRRSQPGFPDLTLVRNGVLIFAELKSAKGRVSGAQMEWLVELQRVAEHSRETYGTDEHGNVRVFVWRPADLANGTITQLLKDTRS